MASYSWYYGDTDQAIMEGLQHDILGIKVIQEDDKLGGYNVQFGLKDSIRFYHIHFQLGSKKVNTVRYFASSGEQGSNITVYKPDDDKGYGPHEKRNLQGLADYVDKDYPNHAKLLRKLREAWDKAGNPGAPSS